MVHLVPTLFSELTGHAFSVPLCKAHKMQSFECEVAFKDMSSSVILGGPDIVSLFIRRLSSQFSAGLSEYLSKGKDNFQRLVSKVSPEAENLTADIVIAFSFLNLIFQEDLGKKNFKK